MIVNQFRFLELDETFTNKQFINWSRCHEYGYVLNELKKMFGKTVHNTSAGYMKIHEQFAKTLIDTKNIIYNSDIFVSKKISLQNFFIYDITKPSKKQFDVVLCISALEHLGGSFKIEHAFKNLYDMVSPNGRLIITCDYPDVPVVLLEKLIGKSCNKAQTPLNGNNSVYKQPECKDLNIILIDITKNTDLKNIFDNIYKTKQWNNNLSAIPLSGPGSLVVNSQHIINAIKNFYLKENIKTILDIGCGDLSYIDTIDLITTKKIDYVGIDASNFITQINKNKLYGTFFNIDFLQEELPNKKYDLIIVKDVLYHLTNQEIFVFLNQLKKYEYKFIILTSSDLNDNENRNLNNRYRCSKVDLTKNPFNLKPASIIKSLSKTGLDVILLTDKIK